MNADIMLDAFGLIDDRFVIPDEKQKIIPWRRTLTVLVAAVLITAMCIGTTIAVSEGFRDFVFSIFRIETHDIPPATEETHPTEPGLHEMDIVNIDAQVNAWYFSSGGYLMVCDGGFYTSEWTDARTAPEDPAFWEISFDGIEEVPGTRVDFPFTHGEKDFRICFDYAALNGRLAVRVFPEDLDADPIGNGWNVQPIGSRTDAVLLTIPVLTGAGYTHDLFLLDLNTQQAAPLILDAPLLADTYRITEDLHYAIIAGCAPSSYEFHYWLYDLESGETTELPQNVQSVWFLDAHTLAYRQAPGNDRFSLIRYHIPTGVEQVVLSNVSSDDYRPIRSHWAEGDHGLLYGGDGTVSLVDFRTGEQMELTGLDAGHLICDESPDGSRIMLGYQEGDGFASLGILDPETGVLKLLSREVSGIESFAGWLDRDTLVITAHDIPDADLNFTPGDGYYVYVYRFN